MFKTILQQYILRLRNYMRRSFFRQKMYVNPSLRKNIIAVTNVSHFLFFAKKILVDRDYQSCKLTRVVSRSKNKVQICWSKTQRIKLFIIFSNTELIIRHVISCKIICKCKYHITATLFQLPQRYSYIHEYALIYISIGQFYSIVILAKCKL